MADAQAPGRPDSPGVRLPPPLIYLALFGAGALLQRLAPLALPGGAPARAAALLLAGAGVALAAWSNVLFRRTGNTPVTVRPASSLVTWGPYRRTRNPMYVGLLLIYAAAALWAEAAWPLILAPAAVLLVRRLVIDPEERYLARRFGDEYRAYCARVRRWL